MKKINQFKYILMILVLILGACVTSQIPTTTTTPVLIPAFRNVNDSLVILPKLIIDTRKNAANSYNYSVVELLLEDIKTQKEKIIKVKYSSNDYVCLQDIPAGKYLIKELKQNHFLSWFIKNKESFDKYLEVEAGKITIFPYKLVITIYAPKSYSLDFYSLIEIEKEDMNTVITMLEKDNNFKSWVLYK